MAVTTLKRRGLCDGFPRRVGRIPSRARGGDPFERQEITQRRPSKSGETFPGTTAGDVQPQENRPRTCASWGDGCTIPSSHGFGWMSVRSCAAPSELVGQATW